MKFNVSVEWFLTVSVVIPGALTPCEQGGTCVNTPGSFQCNCSNGFTGPRCEININECQSSPCQNEGSCLDKIGQFTCLCMDGKRWEPMTHGKEPSIYDVHTEGGGGQAQVEACEWGGGAV